MNEVTLDRANKINKQIKELQQQIEEFPRYIIDPTEYKKSRHMYVKRFLIKERYKIKIPKGYFTPDLEFELSEEDLQALVDIRKRKVEKLENELKICTKFLLKYQRQSFARRKTNNVAVMHYRREYT